MDRASLAHQAGATVQQNFTDLQQVLQRQVHGGPGVVRDFLNRADFWIEEASRRPWFVQQLEKLCPNKACTLQVYASFERLVDELSNNVNRSSQLSDDVMVHLSSLVENLDMVIIYLGPRILRWRYECGDIMNDAENIDLRRFYDYCSTEPLFLYEDAVRLRSYTIYVGSRMEKIADFLRQFRRDVHAAKNKVGGFLNPSQLCSREMKSVDDLFKEIEAIRAGLAEVERVRMLMIEFEMHRERQRIDAIVRMEYGEPPLTVLPYF